MRNLWHQSKYFSNIRINYAFQVEYRLNNEFENGSAPAVELDDFSSPTGWKLVTTDARLESRHYPLFEEPSPIVVFDFAFSKKVYFNPVTGKVMRVSQ